MTYNPTYLFSTEFGFSSHNDFADNIQIRFNIPPQFIPGNAGYTVSSALAWWQDNFANLDTTTSSANFDRLFVTTTDVYNDGGAYPYIEIVRENGALAEIVDPQDYINNTALQHDVQKSIAKKYYQTIVSSLESISSSDTNYADYASELIRNEDNGQSSSTDGDLFYDFLSSSYSSQNNGVTLPHDAIDALIIDLAARDAELRLDTTIPINSQTIAQYHYDAIDNLNQQIGGNTLSKTMWFGTFFEEFVGSGSWAPVTFDLITESGFGGRDTILLNYTSSLIQNVSSNTVGTTQNDLYARDSYLDFIGHYIVDDSGSVQIRERVEGFVDLSIDALATILQVSGVGAAIGSALDLVSGVFADAVTNLIYTSPETRFIESVIYGIAAQAADELSPNGTDHIDSLKVLQLTSSVIKTAILAEELSATPPANYSNDFVSAYHSLIKLESADSELLHNDVLTAFDAEIARQGLSANNHALVIKDGISAAGEIYSLAKDIFAHKFPNSNLLNGGNDTSEYETDVNYYSGIPESIKLYAKDLFGASTDVLINSLGHLFHRTISIIHGDPKITTDTNSLDLYGINGKYEGVFDVEGLLEGPGSSKVHSINYGTSVVFWGSDEDDDVTYVSSGHKDKIFLGNGNNKLDAVLNSSGIYVISGSGDDEIVGGSGNDNIYGGSGSDIIFGGSGHDKFKAHLLSSGTEGDYIYGGNIATNGREDGYDQVDYSQVDVGYGIKAVVQNDGSIKVWLWDATTNSTIGSSYDTLTSVEHVLGTEYSDYFVFNSNFKKFFFSGLGGDDYYDISNVSGSFNPVKHIQENANEGNDYLIAPGYNPDSTIGTPYENGGGGTIAPDPTATNPAPGGTIFYPDGNGGIEGIKESLPGPSYSFPAFEDQQSVPEDETPTALSPVVTTPGSSSSPVVGVTGGFDPLVFDLDKDGQIELVSLDNSSVYFDYLQDGYAEKTGWVSADDGMLAIDLDGSGIIDSITELFGSNYPLSFIAEEDFGLFNAEETGFARLRAHDENADGFIDAQDAIWQDLLIWQDSNQDGVSDVGELHTLDALGIQNIVVGNGNPDELLDTWLGFPGGGFGREIEGHTITHSSSYTLTDNSTYEVVDAWYESDLINSRDDTDFTLDTRSLLLPDLKGYGQLSDLYISASIDNGIGGLLEQLEAFTISQTFETGFTDFETVRADVRDIILNWAGIDESASTTYRDHGVWGLMPEYQFLRVLTGQNSEYRGTWFDGSNLIPYTQDGTDAIFKAFNGMLDGYVARLTFQTGAKELFDGDVIYNPITDKFEGTFQLSQTAIQTLETEATGHSDVEGFWHNVAKFIENTMGVSQLTSTEEGWLDSAVANSSSASLSWLDIENTLLDSGIVYGTTSAETINGTRYDDYIEGNGGDDTLIGGDGDDYLDSSDGNNNTTTTLIGGLGNDVLSGGAGNDTYVYDWGHDTIINGPDSSLNSLDILKMGAGISVSDVSLHLARTDTNQTTHFVVQVEGRGTISINMIDSTTYLLGDAIDEIHFTDDPNTILDVSSMDITVHGTARDDLLGPSQLEGTHTFYGYEGNDNIQSQYAIIADGGNGNNVLNGTIYDDVYVLSSGASVVRESGGVDRIILPEGYDQTSISFYRTYVDPNSTAVNYGSNFDDMVVSIDGLGSIAVIDGLFNDGITDRTVDNIELFNGTLIDTESFTLEVRGTDGDDYIDNVNSSYWSNHDDVYVFGLGNDILYESHANDGFDTVRFDAPITFEDLTIERRIEPLPNGYGTNYLYIGDNNGNSLSVVNQFKYSNANTQESGFSIERLAFADSSTVDLSALEIATYGTAGDDNFAGAETGDASVDDTLYGLAGNDTISGNEGDDFIDGGDGDDSLYGGAGDDFMIGGLGSDTLSGDAGNDTYLIGFNGMSHANIAFDNDASNGDRDYLHVGFLGALSMADITITANNFYNTDMTFADGSTAYFYGIQDTAWTASDFIFAIGGTAAGETLSGALNNDWDAIYGFDGDDFLYGRGGRDALHGGLGVDRLEGGEGDDWLYGDEGNDTLAGQEGDDYIEGGDGNDTVYGNEGHDEIHGGLGADALWGLEGRDVIYGGDGDDGIYGDHRDILTGYAGAGDDELHGGAGNDNIKAGEGDDLAYGDDGADSIYGNDGNDTLWGGTGYDYLYGGEGQDILYGEDGEDQLRGNEGNDILDGGDHKDTIYGDDGDDILDGGIGNYRDNLAGGAGNDTLYGREGNDYLYGDNDDDTLYGGDGVDNLRGNFGNDTLYGEDGWDFLDGDDGDDFLYGGSGNDQLSGDNGNDLINGGTGLDTLYGHSGNDTFAFYAGDLDGSRDFIMDWSNGSNIIDISDVINYSSANGDNILDFVQFNAGGSYTRINVDADGSGTSSSWTAVTQIQNTTGLDIQTMIANGSLIVE